MRKLSLLPMAILASGLVMGHAADVKRTAFTPEEAKTLGKTGSAAIATVGNLVFPGGVYGTDPDPKKQVEEVVQKMHALLAKQGLGIGNMLQHTLFIKAGVVSPMDALGKFHPATYALAPQLKTLKSVGTIIQVPEFPDPKTAVMLDVVAGSPLAKAEGTDGYTRVPFKFGPGELSETVGDSYHVFTAGTEGLDFSNGKLAPDLDGQVTTVVDKLYAGVKAAGLSLSHMVQHNIYITKGNDPMRVIQKFHEELQKREPGVVNFPSAGSIMIVNGMAVNTFRLEMDAVLTKQGADAPKRTPLANFKEVAQSVANGDLVFVTAMPGADFSKQMAMASGLDAQINLAVKNVADALKKQGSSLDKLVKYRLIVKKGAGDIAKARATFLAAATKLAPGLKKAPGAETLLVVEGLAGDNRLVEVSAIATR